MSHKSQRKKLQRFIENMSTLKNMLDISVTDKEHKEITVKYKHLTTKFFPSLALKCFIVMRKDEENQEIDIEDVHFTKKMYNELIQVIDAFIEGRSYIVNTKNKKHGNNKRAAVKRKTNSYS